MKKKVFSIVLILAMVFSITSAISAEEPEDFVSMFVIGHTEGGVVAVTVDPYNGIESSPINVVGHEERLDPTNVYGEFDATTTTGLNEFFFGLASRAWTNYTFEHEFANVPVIPDIKFREVTWGTIGSWHAEAALVFLTDAYVLDAVGNIVPYTPTTEEGYGYFAGIVGNKECYYQFTDEQDAELLANYSTAFGVGSRSFYLNEIETDPDPYATRTTTLFHLPDEVVYAGGMTLVDITRDVYNQYSSNPSTFLNVNGDGRELTFVERLVDPSYPYGDKVIADYTLDPTTGEVANIPGNTDGFDLDAIQVYQYIPDLHNICGYKIDADTGVGLEGWEIKLFRRIADDWIYIDSDYTDSTGKYCFTNLPVGEYRVEEVMQTNWEKVFPTDAHQIMLPKEDVVFGIERYSGKIFKIDPTTLTAEATFYYQISELPLSNVGPNGLAFDQMTGNLYFTTYRGLAKLYVTDDPVEEYLGTLEGEIACADFFDGRYYYIAGGTQATYGGPTDDLYEVTFKADGTIDQVTKFADISGAYDSAWTFDGDIAVSADGTIYGFGKNNPGSYEFFKVNRDGTGFEMIKDFGYAFSLQLAFNGDGVLYGHDAQLGRFFEVNTSDGSITEISDGTRTYTDTASGTMTYNFENRTTLGQVPAFKFYDANVNGIFDEGEVPIEGWKIEIHNEQGDVDTKFTDEDGLVMFTVPYGDYTIREIMPNETCWMATTALSHEVTVIRNDIADRVEFGNICLGSGGGLTLGFWSNRNGQALIGDDDLAMLRALNLRKADGTVYDPATVKDFRIWLLGGSATNMSYMLSVQLSAMELNVFNGKVLADALIYAPGTNSVNALGFATVATIMEEANAELGLHGTAYAGDEWHLYQEALKNALDRANNNYNFVQPMPCSITY